VTGLAREGIDFPCFGPVSLLHFCQQWKIETHPGDEHIALAFVDSQGTRSLEDSGEHRALGLAAVTTALGLQLCVANWSRPTKLDVAEIMGAVKMNLFVNRANGSVCPHPVAVMHPDVYQQNADGWSDEQRRAHEEEKDRDNEACRKRWQTQESKLRRDDFKVWLMDSPWRYFEGYRSAMRELAIWIAELARRHKRSFRIIDGFMTAVCDGPRRARSWSRRLNTQLKQVSRMRPLMK
jgi:hypothetical protein